MPMEMNMGHNDHEDEENICENCGKPFEGDPQQCEVCGMDGLGNCCIGIEDHPCEDAEEDD